MKKILIFSIMIVFLSSCVKELIDTIDKAQKINGVIVNPSLAAPLVNSTLSMNDIISELQGLSFLKVEKDGGLTLVYQNEYQSKKAEDLISLTDQSSGYTFALSAMQLSTLNTSGSVTINATENFDYDLGTSEIDRILYKGGTAIFDIATTLQHDVKATVSLNNGMRNGVPLAAVLQANYTVGTPNTASSSLNLDGYDVDFSKTAAGTSQIEISVKLEITKKGSNPILPSETIQLDLGLQNQKFKELVGYLGAIDFSNAVDTLDIPFFNEIKANFTLADPRIKINFSNSFGVPIDGRITQFYGTNANGTRVDLTGIPSPLPIPNLTLNEIGLTKKGSVLLNKNTSNLADFINNQPNKVVYEFKVEANPSGPSVRNWFVDSSRLGGSVEIEVPLYGTAKDVVFNLDQPFKFDLEDVDLIEEVLLKLYTENSFPIGVSLQAYFRDSITNTTLDSLLGADQLILPAGNVDAQGIVISANPKSTDITLNQQRADRLRNANQIRLKFMLNTTFEGTNQPDVRFTLDNNVKVKLGVQATALINQKF